MMNLTATILTFLAATDGAAEFTSRVYDLPKEPWQWFLYIGGFIAITTITIVVYLRDTSDYSAFWKLWLTSLRIAVLAVLAVIILNPQERTQTMSFHPSRVAILVDTSLSMGDPQATPSSDETASKQQTRAQAVKTLLADSPLLDTLRKDHDVSLYTFDSTLAGPHHVYRTTNLRAVAPSAKPNSANNKDDDTTTASANKTKLERSPDWDEVLQPRGLETRLGESLLDLIRQITGQTLSGIVVVTDGASNAGIEAEAANEAAKAARVRLVTVGVGSTEKQLNLQVAGIQAPTIVHMGDSYEILAFVKGQGIAGRSIVVELLSKPQQAEGEPSLIESREVAILEDGIPVEVKFKRQPTTAGNIEFFVRARTTSKVREFRDDDNLKNKSINIVERKTRTLLIAGGPMRDYRFLRNMLYRHPGIDVDVWLQSADVGTAVSQDSNQLLSQFPETREEFFGTDTIPGYDVVIAFDPDWSQMSSENIELLREWVYSHAGGLILVAGEVNTSELASAVDELKDVLELYPVLLNSYLIDARFDQESEQAWPVEFTREGQNAGFLQLEEDAADSAQTWKDFGGFFGCYPTSGPKAGAAVFAHFSDPRKQTEYGSPILLASQFYGSGRTLYVGSAELWRLRAIDEEYFDRFWTKIIREMAQARMKRGTNRGMLLPERKEYYLGQTIRVRARLLDPQFHPLSVDSVLLEVYDPTGKPLVPARRLLRDKNRPGEYVGDFRASLRGKYKLELPIPESKLELTEQIDVRLPNLEFDNSRQDAQLLRSLSLDTGGTYLSMQEALAEIPKRLPNRGEQFRIDERLRTLWDRQWVLYLLVGLLSVEWLTRKLLKLA